MCQHTLPSLFFFFFSPWVLDPNLNMEIRATSVQNTAIITFYWTEPYCWPVAFTYSISFWFLILTANPGWLVGQIFIVLFYVRRNWSFCRSENCSKSYRKQVKTSLRPNFDSKYHVLIISELFLPISACRETSPGCILGVPGWLSHLTWFQLRSSS